MRAFKIYILPIVIVILGYLIVDNILYDRINAKPINENGFQANYFAKADINNKTAIILIGGGQWGDYWAKEFANNEMVGLSLPYIGKKGLPKLPEEIDLEYFENAIKWLAEQKEVNPNKIIVMGASRNAELALVIASTFTKTVKGVIAYAPSCVSWSNTVLPYNSNETKPSWSYKGNDIPYLPMQKMSVNDSGNFKMIEYWENGLSDLDLVAKAFINVEQITGPILLFSGIDDKVWPSAKMADMIEERLKEKNFKYSFENIKYENAGHLISGNPEQKSSVRNGEISIDGKYYNYKFGGTDDGDFKAKKHAKRKLMQFLEGI